MTSHTLTITGLSHEGRGIGSIDQKKILIRGALPDEVIQVNIKKKHSRHYEGEVSHLLKKSIDRTIPPCPHFTNCGGCSLQHMHVEAQLAFKEKMLVEQLHHFGNVTPRLISPPIYAETLGYRHKARLGVRFVSKKNKLLVGFRENNSRYLADIEKCYVLNPKIGQRLKELAHLIHQMEAYQHIPQVEVAIGDTEAALIFRHTTHLSAYDLQLLIIFGQENNFQIYTQPNPPAPIIKQYPHDNVYRLSYTLENLRFNFHPLDFTQIHSSINRLMVKQALVSLALTKEDNVLDLFCGIGNFTLPIAKIANSVVGIEGSSEMVARGYENAKLNEINTVSFLKVDLMKEIEKINHLGHFNKILIDPPRVGAKEIIPFLGHSQAQKIVYISCNPATLARDAGQLVHQYGYQLEEARVINMFPHTSHTEAMAVFMK